MKMINEYMIIIIEYKLLFSLKNKILHNTTNLFLKFLLPYNR